MQNLRSRFAIGLVVCLGLSCGSGCSGTPDEGSAFAVPSFGGVPEQWEPEVTTADIDESNLEF